MSQTGQKAMAASLPVAIASDQQPVPVMGFGGTINATMSDKFSGNKAQISPMRDLKTIEPFRLVGTSFTTSNDTNFWTVSNSGAASGATVNVIATLTSGTGNSGYGQIQSVRSGRFIFANPNQFRCISRVTATTVALNTRRWGAFTVSGQTPQDGFYFELSAVGVLSVNMVKGGTPTSIESGLFNGDVGSIKMDTQKHSYEIIYFMEWADFYVDNVWIHRISPTTAPMTNTLLLPVGATSINSASGVTSGVLEVWSAMILRLGKENSEPKSIHLTTAATTTLKLGAGNLHRIVLNNAGGTLITIYDNTAGSGTVLAIINTPETASAISLDYFIPFAIGLTIVTTGTWDLTVIYE